MERTKEQQADYYAEALEPYTLAALTGLLAAAAGTTPPATVDGEFEVSVAAAAVRIGVATRTAHYHHVVQFMASQNPPADERPESPTDGGS